MTGFSNIGMPTEVTLNETSDMKTTVAAEGVRSAPPVALTVMAAIDAITLNEWVAIATLAYIAMQVGYLGWKWYREYKAK